MQHKVVSQDEWLAARKALLAKEKEFTRRATTERGSAATCPGSRSRRTTSSTGRTAGKRSPTCSAAKASSSSIISCSAPAGCRAARVARILADHFDGAAIHLAQRDVTLVVSRARRSPRSRRTRSAWAGSSNGSRPTVTTSTTTTTCRSAPDEKARGEVRLQLRDDGISERRSAGPERLHQGKWRGVPHLFVVRARPRHAGRRLSIPRLAPKGRDEGGLPWSMAWVKRHDEYEAAAPSCCGGAKG